MATQTNVRLNPAQTEELVWTLGSDLVAIVVAAAFWYAVAWSTVWALAWLFRSVAEVEASAAWYVVPALFSISEMGVYKIADKLPPYVLRAGRWITRFDMITTIVAIFLVLLTSFRIAPLLAKYPVPTVVVLLIVSVLVGVKVTVWPERIAVDAVTSIYGAVKPLIGR